jgi:hypothetical protein
VAVANDFQVVRLACPVLEIEVAPRQGSTQSRSRKKHLLDQGRPGDLAMELGSAPPNDLQIELCGHNLRIAHVQQHDQ